MDIRDMPMVFWTQRPQGIADEFVDKTNKTTWEGMKPGTCLCKNMTWERSGTCDGMHIYKFVITLHHDEGGHVGSIAGEPEHPLHHTVEFNGRIDAW